MKVISENSMETKRENSSKGVSIKNGNSRVSLRSTLRHKSPVAMCNWQWTKLSQGGQYCSIMFLCIRWFAHWSKYIRRSGTNQNRNNQAAKIRRFQYNKMENNGEFFEKLEFKNEEEHSVLGLCWDLENDSFFYKIRENGTPDNSVWTKRKVLSKIGKMYDTNKTKCTTPWCVKKI